VLWHFSNSFCSNREETSKPAGTATGDNWNTLMHNFAATKFRFRSELEVFCDDMDIGAHYDEYLAQGLLDVPHECGNRGFGNIHIPGQLICSLLLYRDSVLTVLEVYDRRPKTQKISHELQSKTSQRSRSSSRSCLW